MIDRNALFERLAIPSRLHIDLADGEPPTVTPEAIARALGAIHNMANHAQSAVAMADEEVITTGKNVLDYSVSLSHDLESLRQEQPEVRAALRVLFYALQDLARGAP